MNGSWIGHSCCKSSKLKAHEACSCKHVSLVLLYHKGITETDYIIRSRNCF